jgi:hypothetical protein
VVLAYVFWHRPLPDVSREAYEATLVAFHRALASPPPSGFLGSACYRVGRTPWLGASTYEDRYLLEDSAALDVLNDAAITGTRREPHDAAARAASTGTAGLYRLVRGRLAFADVRLALWFSKPEGWSHDEVYRSIAEAAAGVPAQLWVRNMALGPTPELCVLAAEPVELPAGIEPRLLRLELVFAGAL